MRGIAGYILNALTALSLLLCVAAVALWVRSYFARDSYTVLLSDGSAAWVEFPRRSVQFVRATPAFNPDHSGWSTQDAADPLVSRRVVGFGRISVSGTLHNTNVARTFPLRLTATVIPLAGVALLSAPAPIVWFWRRLRRVAPGFCPRCRYDLTGNVSGFCPECGTKIPVAVPPGAGTMRP